MIFEKRKNEREFLVKWTTSFRDGELVIGAYDEKQLRKKFVKLIRKSLSFNHNGTKLIRSCRLAKITSIEKLYYHDHDSYFIDKRDKK